MVQKSNLKQEIQFQWQKQTSDQDNSTALHIKAIYNGMQWKLLHQHRYSTVRDYNQQTNLFPTPPKKKITIKT